MRYHHGHAITPSHRPVRLADRLQAELSVGGHVSVLKLHIQDDDGNSTIVPLVRDEVTIGRQEGNTIRLTDRNVSRRHGRLRQVSDGTMVFEEVSARFGTRVNGSSISGQARITPGDVIEIGDYKLALTLQAGAQANAQAASRAPTVINPPPPPVAIHRGSEDGATSMIQLDDINEILDDGDAREIPATHHARLVILSDNVRQREIRLTRTPTVIGRTDDNTVQIDHRSISRNHAKIVWSDGTYTVRDLDSANGIRVNGDFYKRSDLHSGDELELGHVVLKFFSGGDTTFPAQDDIPVAEEAPSNLGRFALIGLLGIAVVIVGAWFTYFSQPTLTSKSTTSRTLAKTSSSDEMEANRAGDESSGAATKSGSESPNRADSLRDEMQTESEGEPNAKTPLEPATASALGKVPSEPKPENAPGIEEKPSSKSEAEVEEPSPTKEAKAAAATPKGPSVEELLATAKREISKEQFAEARETLGAALAINPQTKGVDQLLNRIAVEERGKEALASAEGAMERKDWKAAHASAESGLVKAKGSTATKGLKAIQKKAARSITAGALARGDRALRNKRYTGAIAAYREALEYDKRNAQARTGLRRAKRMNEKAQPAVANAPEKKPAKVVEKKVEAESKTSKLDQAKAIYEQARAAKRSGRIGEAATLYKKCLSVHGGMANCRSELAIVLMAQGKKCTALSHMRKYIKLRPGGAKSAQFRRLVEQFEPQCQ